MAQIVSASSSCQSYVPLSPSPPSLISPQIPHMKPPYTTYITRHPSAVAHLNALPQTPALSAYLAHTHTLAQSYTHAWDLPSLLIKPVQRLLKYPLLLTAIMNDTEPGPAKDSLRQARDQVEEVARAVNEGRRRREVVKNLLDEKHPPPVRLKSIKGVKLRSGSKDDHDQLDMLEKVRRSLSLSVSL
jgi:dynamin-binding protein